MDAGFEGFVDYAWAVGREEEDAGVVFELAEEDCGGEFGRETCGGDCHLLDVNALRCRLDLEVEKISTQY